mgnify:CR=1 FL=1|tara:strand:+ start:35 stop:907 length:873 start_codon:yes stop_codon:yes gene_type:complete
MLTNIAESFLYADGSFAIEIGQIFEEKYRTKNERENVIKISYQFREAFTMFDLCGIRNEKIDTNVYLICIDKEGGAAIMRKRPPTMNLLRSSLVKLREKTVLEQARGNEDFDVYKSAKAIVDELENNKPALIILTSDVFDRLEFEDLSVLIVVKENGFTNVMMVDPSLTNRYERQGLTFPSIAHQSYFSPAFQLRKSMVEALFLHVNRKKINTVPMKIIGSYFQTQFSSRLFPIFLAMLMNELFLGPNDASASATIRAALSIQSENAMTSNILQKIFEARDSPPRSSASA